MLRNNFKFFVGTFLILALSLAAVSPACAWMKKAAAAEGLAVEICSDLGVRTLILQADGTFKEQPKPLDGKASADCPVCLSQAQLASAPEAPPLPIPALLERAEIGQHAFALPGMAAQAYAARGPPVA